MSNQFFDREITRRKFLQLTAKGTAALAASAPLLDLFRATVAEAEAGALTVIPTATGVLVSNAGRCTGCGRCEVNCTLLNDGKAMPYISRVKLMRNLYLGNDKTGEGGVYSNFDYKPDTCHQCEDPACLKACPMKAIYCDETTGVRKIDKEKCVGCGACVAACPFGMPTIDPDEGKSTKCVSCGYCASMCPCGALTICTWEQVAEAMAK